MPAAVFPHLDFNALIDAFTGLERPSSPALQPVIIPSLPFGDHLQRRIADRFGVCMGLEFLMPQDFIHRAVGPGEDSPWSKSRLIWKVLPHVPEVANVLGVETLSLRDRFALAGVLADRLDQYGHFRPDMIRRWASGDERKTSESEAWQRKLWKQLSDEIPVLHPALRMSERLGEPDFLNQLTAQYPKLQVMGSGTLDPLLVELLGMLAKAGSDVSIHIVLPSLGFLGDLRRHQSLPNDACDPESIEISEGHPLLQSLGRQAVGAFLLLGQLDENYTHWPDMHDEKTIPLTLLSRIQSDIRALRTPQYSPSEPGDSSIQVHSCFGARREMEVLRDEILRAFTELPDLKPDEVHVITPDLATYAPLVSAVLGQGVPELPVRLSEVVSSQMDPIIDGLLALLELAHRGRCQASDVMELIQKPAILVTLGGDDGHFLQWIKDSGFMQGLGEATGQSAFARNRLVAGRFFGADSSARYPDDGTYVLPVTDQLGGDMEQRSRFLVWFSTLETTLHEWSSPSPASRWADRIRLACQTLLGDDKDEGGLSPLQAIAFLADQNGEELLDAGAIFDWMHNEFANDSRRIGVAGRIAFGRFKQLHNLPCRVLAMVGMQDANFPARNRVPAWDLLRDAPRVWDRTPRLDDRQLFLDALLTPTDRLIITSSTRNLRTRETEPFSSCVDELLRVVAAMGGGRPVIEQRLQPFAADYFRGESLPKSFDGLYADVAEKICRDDQGEMSPFWVSHSAPAILEKTGEITINRLVAFWKDPARAFLKACGIYPADEEASDEELNRAPLALEPLGAWEVKHAIMQTMMSTAPQIDLLAAKSSANRHLPPGHLGALAWQETLNRTTPLGAAVEKFRGNTISLKYESESGVCVSGALPRSKDDAAWLTYRTGEFKDSKHYLEPWILTLLAAACGDMSPIWLLDECHTNTPIIKEPLPEEESKAILHALVTGYLEGQFRPLCFAPRTSCELIKKLDGKNGTHEAAIMGAKNAWSLVDRGFGSGEGHDTCARLAWRDRDPFEEREEWIFWAEAVSRPLRKWEEVS